MTKDIDYIKYWQKAVDLEGLTLDPWQEKVMQHKGCFVLQTGRQVGKSKTTSRKATKLSIEYPDTEMLVIAASQRQSSYIFQKMMWIYNKIDELLLIKARKERKSEWNLIKNRRDLVSHFNMNYGFFRERPTKTKAELKNGSTVYCLPAGKTGVYLRCFTIDFLIGDEAAYIPEPVYVAVKPMLAVSRQLRGLGWEMYLSTPFGKGGHFYECCHDNDFLHIHVSSEDCPRIPRDFLKKERQKLSRIEYAQEYLGEFIDEFNQLFPTKLIQSRMTFISWDGIIHKDRKYYLGGDVARFGQDENAFIINEMRRVEGKDLIRVIYAAAEEKRSIPQTYRRYIELDKKFNFAGIMIDSAGVGGGVFDLLMEDSQTKRKTMGIENARKTIDKDGRKGKLMKEDLYSNAVSLMEKEPASIEIISDLKLLKSLKSMTFEYTSDRNLKIFGKYSHLSEAFVRACWCVKTKHLNLYCY